MKNLILPAPLMTMAVLPGGGDGREREGKGGKGGGQTKGNFDLSGGVTILVVPTGVGQSRWWVNEEFDIARPWMTMDVVPGGERDRRGKRKGERGGK